MPSSVQHFRVDRLRHDDDTTPSTTETDDASSPLLRPSPPPPSSTSVSVSVSASASRRTPDAHRRCRRGLKRDLRGGTLSTVRRPDTNFSDVDGERYYYSYAYAYGPAGLCANTYALRCAVFASIGGLTFGYDQGVIANVLVMDDFVARWPIGPWERGLMSTSPARFSVSVNGEKLTDGWASTSGCT
jgi:hypothetical protein